MSLCGSKEIKYLCRYIQFICTEPTKKGVSANPQTLLSQNYFEITYFVNLSNLFIIENINAAETKQQTTKIAQSCQISILSQK